MTTKRPIIIAHRGVHDRFPENSLAAFEEAGRVGLEWVECDVWPSADGTVVVIHDETLDRTTTGKGIVWRRRWDDLRHLRLRRADGSVDESSCIPTLDELADRPVRRLLVEIKPSDSPAFVREVIRVLASRRPRDGWMIQSFDEANLIHALAAVPDLSVAYLVEDREALARAIARGWKNIYMCHELLDERVAGELRGKGVCVGVWTPNGPEDLKRVLDQGADVIITDEPARATMMLTAPG